MSVDEVWQELKRIDGEIRALKRQAKTVAEKHNRAVEKRVAAMSEDEFADLEEALPPDLWWEDGMVTHDDEQDRYLFPAVQRRIARMVLGEDGKG